MPKPRPVDPSELRLPEADGDALDEGIVGDAFALDDADLSLSPLAGEEVGLDVALAADGLFGELIASDQDSTRWTLDSEASGALTEVDSDDATESEDGWTADNDAPGLSWTDEEVAADDALLQGAWPSDDGGEEGVDEGRVAPVLADDDLDLLPLPPGAADELQPEDDRDSELSVLIVDELTAALPEDAGQLWQRRPEAL